MEYLMRLFVRVRELQRGQTMTEYALILAAVAIVVYTAYQLMGSDIGALATKVDGYLT